MTSPRVKDLAEAALRTPGWPSLGGSYEQSFVVGTSIYNIIYATSFENVRSVFI